MADETRTYPLQRPPNHQPPVPRWQLVLPQSTNYVFVACIGVQHHGDGAKWEMSAVTEVEETIESWRTSTTGDEPSASERFRCIQGHDRPGSAVWVCYWDRKEAFDKSLDRLSLSRVHAKLDSSVRHSIGLWSEAFASAVNRLETNYTGTDYLPGLARLPNAKTEEHTLSAYWGAARDRIPSSAFDRFDPPAQGYTPSTLSNRDLSQDLTGSSPLNLVHIRSGQYWEACGTDEVQAYETKLEPALESGLQYLWNNPEETGAMGLRYLRNEENASATAPETPRKETCVAGFFTNLGKLETWAHTHRSHLKIYHGALNHAKVFGKERKFRTWHEVSVLETDAAKFRYINCVQGSGVTGLLPLH